MVVGSSPTGGSGKKVGNKQTNLLILNTMMKFFNKYEKYIYPLVMGLSLLSALTAYLIDKDFTWQIMTFVWTSIAWNNFQKIPK
jgi:hypothetical protein